MRKLAIALIMFGYCIAGASGAQIIPRVTTVNLTVYNNSDRCAWVTIYSARATTRWAIVGSGWVPGTRQRDDNSKLFKVVFTNVTGIPLYGEIRVRAEFRPSGCTGSGGDPDVESANRQMPADEGVDFQYPAHAYLEGNNGNGYRVKGPFRR